MIEKYNRQLKKGVLDMLVLKLLANSPQYGYQLISQLKELSDGVFVLKDGTLYPILYRLEDDGLVAGKWSEAKGRQIPRKYYEITEKGKNTLTQIYEIWQSIEAGVEKIMEA